VQGSRHGSGCRHEAHLDVQRVSQLGQLRAQRLRLGFRGDRPGAQAVDQALRRGRALGGGDGCKLALPRRVLRRLQLPPQVLHLQEEREWYPFDAGRSPKQCDPPLMVTKTGVQGQIG